ncbi:GAF domain-containing protein [Aliiglaciecola litoralis]|uniref:GAF domain-containing protein n=1 Tax=Aliiglaciecola litoralis TaxID=582857 RepID=A0ABP3WPS1_9ALTE
MEMLTDLLISLSNPRKNNQQKLKQICSTTMQAITHANRVSLWAFNQDKSEIVCLMCLSGEPATFTSGTKLNKTDFADYFNAILSEQVLVASDARTHPATKCFNKGYFEPNHIYSLFDYVYHDDFEPKGVICCESVGKPIEWVQSEQHILRKIANITSMFFKSE